MSREDTLLTKLAQITKKQHKIYSVHITLKVSGRLAKNLETIKALFSTYLTGLKFFFNLMITMSKSISKKLIKDLMDNNREYYSNNKLDIKDVFEDSEVSEEFTTFVEKCGIPKILIEAISCLHDLPEKPDDPVNWLKAYFRKDAPERQDALTEEINTLKNEVIEKASKLLSLRIEEDLKMKQLKELKEGPSDIEATDETVLCEKKPIPPASVLGIGPDPFFRLTKSTLKILGIESKETVETKATDSRLLMMRTEKISQSKSNSSRSSVQKIVSNVNSEFELERFTEEGIPSQGTLAHQLDEDNMGGDNRRKHREITLAHETGNKYLHFNSEADSSNSEDNIREGLLNQDSLFTLDEHSSANSENKETLDAESDTADQNSDAYTDIKKTKKVKIRVNDPHKKISDEAGKKKHKVEAQKKETAKMKRRKSIAVVKNTKYTKDAKEKRSQESLAGETEVESEPPKIIDLPKGPGEENMENIPQSYWKTELNVKGPVDSEEDSHSDDDFEIIRSKRAFSW